MTKATSAPTAPPLEPPRYERLYVWQRPIRIYHWTLVASVATLFTTGLLIANPVFTSVGEPATVFVHGRIRMVHFAAGYVLLVALSWRLAWFVLGNRYARSGYPAVWLKRWWSDLVRQLADYLRFDFGHAHAGHNALGGLSYFLFVICIGSFQVLTGFALYGETNPGGFWDSAFGWVIPLLGGSARALAWHHLAAWGFLVFAILHVYVVLLDARQYRNGLLISMITGFKFRRVRDGETPRGR